METVVEMSSHTPSGTGDGVVLRLSVDVGTSGSGSGCKTTTGGDQEPPHLPEPSPGGFTIVGLGGMTCVVPLCE